MLPSPIGPSIQNSSTVSAGSPNKAPAPQEKQKKVSSVAADLLSKALSRHAENSHSLAASLRAAPPKEKLPKNAAEIQEVCDTSEELLEIIKQKCDVISFETFESKNQLFDFLFSIQELLSLHIFMQLAISLVKDNNLLQEQTPQIKSLIKKSPFGNPSIFTVFTRLVKNELLNITKRQELHCTPQFKQEAHALLKELDSKKGVAENIPYSSLFLLVQWKEQQIHFYAEKFPEERDSCDQMLDVLRGFKGEVELAILAEGREEEKAFVIERLESLCAKLCAIDGAITSLFSSKVELLYPQAKKLINRHDSFLQELKRLHPHPLLNIICETAAVALRDFQERGEEFQIVQKKKQKKHAVLASTGIEAPKQRIENELLSVADLARWIHKVVQTSEHNAASFTQADSLFTSYEKKLALHVFAELGGGGGKVSLESGLREVMGVANLSLSDLIKKKNTEVALAEQRLVEIGGIESVRNWYEKAVIWMALYRDYGQAVSRRERERAKLLLRECSDSLFTAITIHTHFTRILLCRLWRGRKRDNY